MELDVHLQRDGAEPWGFRLIGGKDFNMPLTVVKVVPDSPAEKAGLNNGDGVCRINDRDTSDLSHDSAKQAVDDAADMLALAVKRGLYDPVLDEYEPIYDQIDQEDFDQPSQPTEVDPFAVQQFLDQQTPERLPELRDIATPGLTDASELQSRSLTASPFVLSTKPYRPFSTEPLAVVPPLEDPIILNPTYQDEFGKLEDGDLLPTTRFKLPISEQYDPDGCKRKGTEGTEITKRTTSTQDSTRKEVTFEERVKQEMNLSEVMQHKSMIEEVKFMEKMKKELDLDKIEMTAVNLVDESIERAVSVAGEIKKEIDVALSETSVVSSQVKESKAQKELEAILTESSKQSSERTSELKELIDKTTEEIISYNGNKSEVSVTKEVAKIETYNKKEQAVVIDEKRQTAKQEIEETIVAGSVQRKSEEFDKKVEIKSVDAKQSVEKQKLAEDQHKDTAEKNVYKDGVKTESVSQSAQKTTEVKKESVSTSQKNGTKTDSKTSKHNVYNIGLQTIPNIKGSIHSSYHYNLLLKTFFLHLTDVMVALSRFILTESVFNKEETEEKKDTVASESVSTYTSVSQETNEKIVANENREEYVQAVKEKRKDVKQEVVEEKQEVKKAAVEEVITSKKDTLVTEKLADTEEKVIEFGKAEDVREYLEMEEVAETRMLSGSKMAQLTERKSEELTQRMDAVITEFETKAGLEASAEIRERRSRSRSRIEVEVSKESDPLEWLDKVDKQSQQISDIKTETQSYRSESVENSKIVQEKQELKTSKTKEDKQMYVAIVESHVFTNKDAIFQEQVAEFSETSSVQSADEVNVTLLASEANSTEKIALESRQTKHEVAKTVLEESRELSVINAQNKRVEMAKEEIAIIEEVKEEKSIEINAIDTKSTVQAIAIEEVIEPVVLEIHETQTAESAQDLKVTFEERKEVNAVEKETISTVQNIAMQEVIEPVVEIHEIKATKVEDAQRVDIKEEEHVMSVSEITEIAIEESSHKIVQEIKEEVQIATILEEKSLETAVESIKEKALELKEVKLEDPVKIVSTEVNITRPGKLTPSLDEESAELKIVKQKVLEVEQTLKHTEESELLINKHTEIVETESQFTASLKSTTESAESKEVVQEASFTAKSSSEQSRNNLQLDFSEQRSHKSQFSMDSDPPSTINTPTPSTVTPTPLTDEYVFKLQIPLPKNRGTTPVPRDCTPSPPVEEDPHIVKKKLIPHIDTNLESPIIYDPPLPTPPEDNVQSPVYTKPGLRGGSDRIEFRRQRQRKEEILEIGRKSTLLASAIDQTIKSIEEYKEEVGMDTKKEVNFEEVTNIENTNSKIVDEHNLFKQEVNYESLPIIYNGYAKVETKVYDSIPNKEPEMVEEHNYIDKQVKTSTVNKLSYKVNEEVLATVGNTNNSNGEEVMQAEFKQQETSQIIDTQYSISNGNSKDRLIVTPNESEVDPRNVTAAFDVQLSTEIKSVDVVETPAVFKVEEKREPLEGYRPVQFHPEELIAAKKNLQSIHLQVQAPMQREFSPSYTTASGELLGTHQGIVDGLEEAVVDSEVAKELGKPGITEDKIAELISGESEMLREAHVMGLSRVIKSHMHRTDDNSSVDFKKIKPIIESLKDSEVLRALNEELIRTQEERKKEEEKKWTTFMQKPQRPVPRMKFGYYGYVQPEEEVKEPYKVKIVKQPKPKVAPDYKPEDFETGPLPWEERASKEPPPPPVNAEDPILIPEELPEFLEAIDPLPESEVPDLEETGIPLPPPEQLEESQPSQTSEDQAENIEESGEEQTEELDTEAVVEEAEKSVTEMEQNRLAEQLMTGVQSMVDPNASVDQQLAQMRAQLAALAQLPGVIQQTLDLVTRQLSQLTQQEAHEVSQSQLQIEDVAESRESVDVTEEVCTNGIVEGPEEYNASEHQNGVEEDSKVTIVEEESLPNQTEEEREKLKKEEEEMLEEQKRIEKQKKELIEQMRLEQESRQVKQRPTPRVGKPKPVFGPAEPYDRPVVLPGGRRWRKPEDAYNEQFIAETLSAQAEIIQGKAKGSFESEILPYDERINFMKYEKPPVSLDHLQQSETYKLIHNMEQTPVKRVELRTPLIAEADYREKCRSVTPMENHINIPQRIHP